MARRERIPLLEGESLVFELREHCSALIWPAFLLVITTGIGAFLAGTVPDNGAQTTLRLIIAGVCAAIILRWSVWPFLAWYGHSWVLTTKRLIVREGVLSRRGIDVPGQLGIAGFDNLDLTMEIVPRLTTVSIPRYDIGATAARMILKRLADEDVAESADLGFQIIPRDSTHRR